MITRHRVTIGFVLVLILIAVVLYGTSSWAPQAKVGNASFNVEVVRDPATQNKGLAGRVGLPETSAMLFVFPLASRYGFWMDGMQFPIDIFWLGDNGQVVSFAENVQPESYPTVLYPTEAVRYVLETNAGVARRAGIATGTPYTLKNIESVSN